MPPPVRVQVRVGMKLLLGQLPPRVLVERRHAQGQPFDRPKRGQYRGEITAIAAADDGDCARVDARMVDELVESRERVVQIVLTRHRLLLRAVPRVSAKVEGEPDAAERRDLACTRKILLLAAAPAMDEQNPGNRSRRRYQRAGDPLSIHCDLEFVVTRRHTLRGSCTW
jgi:hypothetical protein